MEHPSIFEVSNAFTLFRVRCRKRKKRMRHGALVSSPFRKKRERMKHGVFVMC